MTTRCLASRRGMKLQWIWTSRGCPPKVFFLSLHHHSRFISVSCLFTLGLPPPSLSLRQSNRAAIFPFLLSFLFCPSSSYLPLLPVAGRRSLRSSPTFFDLIFFLFTTHLVPSFISPRNQYYQCLSSVAQLLK